MTAHEKKREIIKKYSDKIKTDYPFYIKGSIPSKAIDNAIKTFASGMDRKTIIGFYDTTLFGKGKNGYIFTDDKVYYIESIGKPQKLWYSDIESMELYHTNKRDCDKGLRFILNDGTRIEWNSMFLNKTPLKAFFEEIMDYEDRSELTRNIDIAYEGNNRFGAFAGGHAMGAYGQVNKMYEEERFHSSQGHGFAAERANNLFDNLTGHKASIVGDDNAKNGPDRVVDGIFIQSKYYQTGAGCVNACFEDNGKGAFRYYANGSPMQIEVPSDSGIYNDAVSKMEEKIRNGQVEGVSEPSEAKNIIKKGHFTYEQARNIAKAGTIESLTYDATNGVIIGASAFGVTSMITFAVSIWNGEDYKTSLECGIKAGIKVFGTSFITTVIGSQLSKAGLNSMLVGGSETIIAIMGPKASAVLINAFRNGTNIYGAAAMKSAAKLLRGNAITAGVTVVVLSTFDVANIFRGRISGKQLFKNIANTASTVAGSTGGWIGGAVIGQMIIPIPGVGAVAGGLIGSLAGGHLGGKASDKIMGVFIEDDADEMIRIIERVFNDMANEYLLSKKEAEKIVDTLQVELGKNNGRKLKDMFASGNRNKFARNMLIPLIEDEVKKRPKVKVPSNADMTAALRGVLEEIADDNEYQSNGVNGDDTSVLYDNHVYGVESGIFLNDFFIDDYMRIEEGDSKSITNKRIHVKNHILCSGTLEIKNCELVFYDNKYIMVYDEAHLKIQNSMIRKQLSKNTQANIKGYGEVIIENSVFKDCVELINSEYVVIRKCFIQDCYHRFIEANNLTITSSYHVNSYISQSIQNSYFRNPQTGEEIERSNLPYYKVEESVKISNTLFDNHLDEELPGIISLSGNVNKKYNNIKLERIGTLEYTMQKGSKHKEKISKIESVAKTAMNKKRVVNNSSNKMSTTDGNGTRANDVELEIVYQLEDNEYTREYLITKAYEIWTTEFSGIKENLKDIKVYIKPEDGMAYCVFNDDICDTFVV